LWGKNIPQTLFIVTPIQAGRLPIQYFSKLAKMNQQPENLANWSMDSIFTGRNWKMQKLEVFDEFKNLKILKIFMKFLK
jgi:hypothetical protein